MNEIEFLELMDQIETTGPTSIKETLLRRAVDQYPEAEEFFRLTFNDTVYGIAEKTFYNAFGEEPVSTFNHVSDFLYKIGKTIDAGSFKMLQEKAEIIASLSGYAQQDYIYDFFSKIGPLRAKWYCRVLLHDLRCGVQVKTINNVFRSLGIKKIPKFALQLAQKLDPFDETEVKKLITFPCVMECKYDGYRIQAEVMANGKVTLMSRRGNDRTNDYPEVVEELREIFKGQHILLDGEMIADSFQKLTRKDDKSSRKYVIFDLLNDEKLPYISRWDNLFMLAQDLNITDYYFGYKINNNKVNNMSVGRKHVFIAEHYSCNNIEEMQSYFDEVNLRGEEGIIVKLYNRIYERGSRKHMFKCKKVYTADLLIVGYAYGDGKKSGKIAALKLLDASGKIQVDVGSGIDDDTCDYFTKKIGEDPGFLNGKICEILYNEKTETGSLRFPRFVKIRDDKDGADDLS